MTKCTGMRCPMQYGYKVDECNHTDCPYRTEPVTNADLIRSMTDEELAELLNQWGTSTRAWQKCKGETMYWLQQPAEGE